MAFEKRQGAEHEKRAFELAAQLDEVVSANDLVLLEKAVRYMAENTRETLKKAVQMAEKN